MATTCINPPDATRSPQEIVLPHGVFTIADGNTVVVLFPHQSNWHDISVITDGVVGMSVSNDKITTIMNNGAYTGGLKATVNVANANPFAITYPISALILTNTSGVARQVSVKQ